MKALFALVLCIQTYLVLSDGCSPNPCPPSTKCCPTGNPGLVACCPANGVCCSDKNTIRCCPQNTVCNLDKGTCDKKLLEFIPLPFRKPEAKIGSVPMKKAKRVDDVYCPDGVSYCPDGSTCCKLQTGEYGCCPYPSAMCCSDGIHCCPSGKVQKVLVFVHGNFRILTAEVQPSQRTGTPNHKPWVIVQSDGVIETAHCNCIAGLGETCSHVAALLFKVERAVNFGYTKTAPTDEICRWNNSFKKKVSPSKVSDLDFSKPKWNEEKKNLERKGISGEEMTDDELNNLRKIAPNAVFFTLTDKKEDTVQMESLPIPESIPELVKKVMHSTEDVEMFLCSFFSDEKCKNLEEKTRGQALNETWFAQRSGRITSSRFGEVLKRKNFSRSFIDSFLNFRNVNTEATRWGRKNEKIAFQAYKLFSEQNHTNFKINECGMFVQNELPYLAASPDAVVACSCCGEGLLEIKCPFKHRNVSPQVAASTDSKFCLDTNLQLKQNHNYFYQVQGQILVTKKKFCDVIVWTTKGYSISRIAGHSETETLLLQKMKEFFFNHVLVELKNK